MKATALVVLVLLLVTVSYAGFAETVYTASLSNDQVVPLPLDPPPTQGTAVCVLARSSNPPVLDCEVQHDVSDPNNATIHVGRRGEAGASLYRFTGALSNNLRQAFPLTDNNGYTSDQQVEDFLNGQWYILIGSREYPAGEIRGQIEHAHRWYSRLSVANTIPRASGSSAKGIAVGTFSQTSPRRRMEIDLVHSVVYPQTRGLEVRHGSNTETGPLAFRFDDTVSPVFEAATLTVSEAKDFYQDMLYLNLASVSNPSGDIRGQIITIDYIDELAFTSRIGDGRDGLNTTVPRGGGLFAYDCQNKVLEYLVMHDMVGATDAYVGLNASVNGQEGALFQLPRVQSPIFGSIQLSAREEYYLYTKSMFVEINSGTNDTAIQGTISVDYEWWAYLSGSNVVSPVTTAAVGLATMKLSANVTNPALDYSIFHTVQQPQQAMIHVAPTDSNGPVAFGFRTVRSPIRGNDFVMDDDDLEAFATENTYITITSLEYPITGEIRGQIRRVDPCKTRNDNALTVGEDGQDPSVTDPVTYTRFVPTSFGAGGGGNDPSVTYYYDQSGSSNIAPSALFVVLVGMLLTLFC